MVDEKIYILDDSTEMIIIERIKYNGIPYMLLKNNKSNEIQIGYEYDDRLIYIDETDDDYEIIKTLLKNQLQEELEKI